MKKLLLFTIVAFFVTISSYSQGYWTQKANYPLAGRQYSCGFCIGLRGYYAFGCGSGFYNSIDLVEYNPTTNTWTQKAPFPGGTRINSHVFVIDTLAYFVSGAFWTGVASDYNGYSDVWVYNPYDNSWTQKNNFPGQARHGGFAFSFNGQGYFGLGTNHNLVFLDDFWRYDPLTDTWTQRANFPGIGRKNGFQFSLDKDGYVGLGYDSLLVALNDVWRYDAQQNNWTQMNNFPSAPRCWLSSFSMNSKGYICTGYLLNSSVATKQFWEYKASTDSWFAMPDYTGTACYTGAGFSVNGKGYNGMGYKTTYSNDFWEFTPSVVGTEEITIKQLRIKSYPNPARNQFYVEVPQLPRNTNKLVIIDELSRLITSTDINGNPQILEINCSKWKAGKYYVVIITGNQKLVSHIVIF